MINKRQIFTSCSHARVVIGVLDDLRTGAPVNVEGNVLIITLVCVMMAVLAGVIIGIVSGIGVDALAAVMSAVELAMPMPSC